MSKRKPLVSVVITNYNYGKYLRQAIESVIDQNYVNTEILLIDDGSTDGSNKIYSHFIKKIRVIEHKKNQGIVATRNEALSKINGEYLCFLDADDILPRDYLTKLFTKMHKEKADIVYTDMQLFGERDEIVCLPEFSLNGIIEKNIVDMGALIRVESIIGKKFDAELDKLSHEDWDFFLGIALEGKKFVKSSDVKLNYRIHENSRNQLNDFCENSLRLLKVTSYVIEKYKKLYPEKVDFSAENEIIQHLVEQHVEILRLDSENRKNMAEIVKKDEKIRDRDETLENISNSRSYKLIRSFGKILQKDRREK